MSNEAMRAEIRNVYKTDTWKWKVDRMPNKQVLAVYLSFKRRGKVA